MMPTDDDNAAMANGEPPEDVVGVASAPSSEPDDLLGFAAAPTPAPENVPPALDLLGLGAPTVAAVPTNGDSAEQSPPMDLLGMGASPSENAPPSAPIVDLFGAFDVAPAAVAPAADEPPEDLLALPEPTPLLFPNETAALPESADAPVDLFDAFQEPTSTAAVDVSSQIEAPVPLANGELYTPASEEAPLSVEEPTEQVAINDLFEPTGGMQPTPIEQGSPFENVEADTKEDAPSPADTVILNGGSTTETKPTNELVGEEEVSAPVESEIEPAVESEVFEPDFSPQEEAVALETEPTLEDSVVEEELPTEEGIIEPPVQNELELQDERLDDEPIAGEPGVDEEPIEEPLVAAPLAEEPQTVEPLVGEVDMEETVISDLVVSDNPLVDEVVADDTLIDKPLVDEEQVDEPLVAAPLPEALVDAPLVDEPIVDEQLVDEPLREEMIIDTPLVNEAVTDEALVDESLVDEPLVDEPLTEEAVIDTPLVDEPLVDEPLLDEPLTEDGLIDTPLVDEPLADEPLIDEPLVDEPLTDELIDTPLVDEPLADVPVADAPIPGEPPKQITPGPIESQLASAESPKPPPKPVVDVAPSWMSAAATPTGVSKPTKPQAVMQRTPSATMVELPPIEPISYASSTQSQQEEQGPDPATQALIVDLQASIQEHLDEREAANERARKAEQRVKELLGVVQIKKELEQELHKTKESLNSAASDREHLLVELDKLREARDEHERKQIVLSNRLNAAKKKEAAKANLAESLDDNVKVLEHDYETAKKKAEEATAAQKELAKELATIKNDFQQRLKKTETQLSEERRLNDERKKKMKSFVENKQEEIRESKSQNDELNMELSQTNRTLREHHSRWKQLHAQWVQSQTRNRELQRDINRMKKESESMSRLGERMNVKMSQSAQETEEHKTKRLTAKQELMNVLEALESERDVSSKLRDSIKFTFTPKALSQQQILKESLREFEHELVRLSTRLGRPLPPSNNTPGEVFAIEDDDEEDTEGSGSNRRTRSEIDSTHLLANLEDETQRVSQCIMALTSNIERLHIVVAQSGERTCVSLFSDLLAGASGTPESGGETAAMTGPRIGIGSARSYGQVPTANN